MPDYIDVVKEESEGMMREEEGKGTSGGAEIREGGGVCVSVINHEWITTQKTPPSARRLPQSLPLKENYTVYHLLNQQIP